MSSKIGVNKVLLPQSGFEARLISASQGVTSSQIEPASVDVCTIVTLQAGMSGLAPARAPLRESATECAVKARRAAETR